ncbi:MAG: sugar phosphate isomerase/epimerase [Firmicutes bacterium]|nr:sugar phosphate isomerase/epimerase [Bacillota bacterium]
MFKLAAFADEASPSLDGQIEALRACGIKYLEIRSVDGQNIADISLEKAGQIRRRLEDEGLAVWAVGSPFGKVSVRDCNSGYMDSFRRCLEKADILGARHVRIFSFYDASGLDEAAEGIGRFLDAAAGSDAVLCHENEKGVFGSSAAGCLELHEALPGLRAVFDPANFVQCGEDPVRAWEALSPYVEYMHVKDALKSGEVVPAGRGDGQIPYLLSQYKGEMLTVEPHLYDFQGFELLESGSGLRLPRGNKYETPQEAFSAAVRAVRGLIGG